MRIMQQIENDAIYIYSVFIVNIVVIIILKITNSTIIAKLAIVLPFFDTHSINILPRSMTPAYEGRAIANKYR